MTDSLPQPSEPLGPNDFTFEIDDDLYTDLERIAVRSGLTVDEQVRAIIEATLRADPTWIPATSLEHNGEVR